MHSWLSKILIGLTCLAVLYVAGNLFLLFDPRGRWTTSWCVRHLRIETTSPDGMMEARAVDFSCDFGAENWTTVVIVKPRHTPSEDDEVLTGEFSGDRLELSWRTPQLLEIAVSSPRHILDYKTEHTGVKVVLIGEGLRNR